MQKILACKNWHWKDTSFVHFLLHESKLFIIVYYEKRLEIGENWVGELCKNPIHFVYIFLVWSIHHINITIIINWDSFIKNKLFNVDPLRLTIHQIMCGNFFLLDDRSGHALPKKSLNKCPSHFEMSSKLHADTNTTLVWKSKISSSLGARENFYGSIESSGPRMFLGNVILINRRV